MTAHNNTQTAPKKGLPWRLLIVLAIVVMVLLWMVNSFFGSRPESEGTPTDRHTAYVAPEAPTFSQEQVDEQIQAALEAERAKTDEESEDDAAGDTAVDSQRPARARPRTDEYDRISEVSVGDTEICRDDVWIFFPEAIDERFSTSQRTRATAAGIQDFCRVRDRATPYDGEVQVRGVDGTVPYRAMSEADIERRQRS